MSVWIRPSEPHLLHPRERSAMLGEEKNFCMYRDSPSLSSTWKNRKKYWPCALLETVFVQEIYGVPTAHQALEPSCLSLGHFSSFAWHSSPFLDSMDSGRGVGSLLHSQVQMSSYSTKVESFPLCSFLVSEARRPVGNSSHHLFAVPSWHNYQFIPLFPILRRYYQD